MRTIPLTQGYSAIVDDEDFDRISQFRWHVKKNVWNGVAGNLYALRNLWIARGLATKKGMAHEVLCVDRSVQIDHWNANGLDNRKSNLRVCSSVQNHGNQRKIKPASSKYRGVRRTPWGWRAQIHILAKTVSLGSFQDEVSAAKAFDEAAKKRFGVFARTNF